LFAKNWIILSFFPTKNTSNTRVKSNAEVLLALNSLYSVAEIPDEDVEQADRLHRAE